MATTLPDQASCSQQQQQHDSRICLVMTCMGEQLLMYVCVLRSGLQLSEQ